MSMELTRAERDGLTAVRDGKVDRIYRADGNVIVPPRGVSAKTVWRLLSRQMVRDARATQSGATILRCKMELTLVGDEALKKCR